MSSIYQDFSNCLGIAAIRDYNFYIPVLIGHQVGLSTDTYRTIGIIFPVLTTAGSYLVLWTKCYGESRNYRDMPEQLCTKWSWTKIMTNFAPAVIAIQLWSSIPYSKYIYPVEEYEFMTDQMIALDNNYQSLAYLSNAAQEISDRFVYAVNISIANMPKVLGTTTLVFSIFMGLQLIVSCCEKRRFGKRDALILALQISAFVVSVLQLRIAKNIDYAPYVNTDLNSCREQYVKNDYNNTLPVDYSCPF